MQKEKKNLVTFDQFYVLNSVETEQFHFFLQISQFYYPDIKLNEMKLSALQINRNVSENLYCTL